MSVLFEQYKKKDSYEKNRLKCLKTSKDYRKTHKIKLNEQSKKWHENNRKNEPWYYLYYKILDRCLNVKSKSYKNYGGRGIIIDISMEEIKKLWFRDCAWRLKRPSIDRIDNNGNYNYNNCRFIELSENIGKDKRKCVLQYDLEGNFIKEWESMVEINKTLKFQQSHICACCKHKKQRAYNYKWEYSST